VSGKGVWKDCRGKARKGPFLQEEKRGGITEERALENPFRGGKGIPDLTLGETAIRGKGRLRGHPKRTKS